MEYSGVLLSKRHDLDALKERLLKETTEYRSEMAESREPNRPSNPTDPDQYSYEDQNGVPLSRIFTVTALLSSIT